jgi:hypothetical protein
MNTCDILIFDCVDTQRRIVLDGQRQADGSYMLLRAIPSGMLCWENNITKPFGAYPDIPTGIVVQKEACDNVSIVGWAASEGEV